MKIAERVIFNTAILYVKILVSLSVSLVTVPLVLRALGASDYGLYTLIAGVVSMLSFLNVALTVSSQRYMSVVIGAGHTDGVNQVYNTSFYLHLILGGVVVVLFEVGSFFLGTLNINPDRLWCAHLIYQFLIFSTFTKIIAVPFDAIMNAHEDMLPFSVIELIDSFLLLLTAISLRVTPFDKLAFYGLSICVISSLTLLMKYLWCKLKYKSYRIQSFRNQKLLLKEMSGFAGWNLFGGLALIGRNQGVAVVINMFLGTVLNAAYGIANQINGALSQFSVTFQKAINPQLMKSEGMNDRARLLKISYMSSKYSVLALCIFAIPIIIEMPDVLNIWLGKDVPPYTTELARCILILTIVYQFSVGIASAVQANGKIRNYQIAMGCIVLLNVPISYVVIKAGLPVYYSTIGFIVLELISLVVRMNIAKKLVQLSIKDYVADVIRPTVIIIFIATSLSLIPHYIISHTITRIIGTCSIYIIAFLYMTWQIGLTNDQKGAIVLKIVSKKSKIRYK